MHAALQHTVDAQMDKTEGAAPVIAEARANAGILCAFGTGHSHVVAEGAASIEIAIVDQPRGVPVIAITFLAHSRGTT